MNKISGFSKLSKNDKIKWIISNHFDGNSNEKNLLKKYWNNDKKIQRIHDDFSENTISNYYMPMGIAPNFNINDQYVILCPTNSHVDNENHRGYRSWPKRKWNDLIKIILRETNLNIFLAGSLNEKEYFKEFYPLDKRVYDVSGLTTIPELISIMKNACYVVATDSGSAHVAGAVCKNIVCIHGPTNHHQSAPCQTYKNNVKVATLNLNCSPCYDTDVIKKCQRNICMQSLSADLVFKLINEF